MPGPEIRVHSENVRSLAFGSIGAAYANVGTATGNPMRIVFVKNNTDATVEVSWDGGITNAFRLPASSHDTLDLTTNKKGIGGFYLSSESQFQVRHVGVAPTTGEVIIQCFYG